MYESTLLRGCYFLEQPQAGVGSYKVRGSRSAHCCSVARPRPSVWRCSPCVSRKTTSAAGSQPSESRKKVLPPPGSAARRRQTEAGERQDPNCVSAGGAAATSAGRIPERSVSGRGGVWVDHTRSASKENMISDLLIRFLMLVRLLVELDEVFLHHILRMTNFGSISALLEATLADAPLQTEVQS